MFQEYNVTNPRPLGLIPLDLLAAPALAGAVGTVMAGGGAYGAYNAFEKVFA